MSWIGEGLPLGCTDFFFVGGGWVLEMETMSQVRCLLSEWFRLLIKQPVVVLLSRGICSSSDKYVYIYIDRHTSLLVLIS